MLTCSAEWPLQTAPRCDLVKRHCLLSKYRMYTDSPESIAFHRHQYLQNAQWDPGFPIYSGRDDNGSHEGQPYASQEPIKEVTDISVCSAVLV